MSIPVNLNYSLFTSLYIVMYNSQSLASNTAASFEHVRLIQSLATTGHINLVCNMYVESFWCSHRWVPSIEFGILHQWFYFSEFVFWWIFVNMAHLPCFLSCGPQRAWTIYFTSSTQTFPFSVCTAHDGRSSKRIALQRTNLHNLNVTRVLSYKMQFQAISFILITLKLAYNLFRCLYKIA